MGHSFPMVIPTQRCGRSDLAVLTRLQITRSATRIVIAAQILDDVPEYPLHKGISRCARPIALIRSDCDDQRRFGLDAVQRSGGSACMDALHDFAPDFGGKTATRDS